MEKGGRGLMLIDLEPKDTLAGAAARNLAAAGTVGGKAVEADAQDENPGVTVTLHESHVASASYELTLT